MVMDHRDKNGRSAIVGTYRVLMYRATCDEIEASKNESVNQQKQANQEQLLVPVNNLLPPSRGSSSKSFKSNKSESPEPNSSNQRLAMPPPSPKQQCQQQSSPAKNKFKHKLSLTIKPNKKNMNTSSEKQSAKKRKVSQACIIL